MRLLILLPLAAITLLAANSQPVPSVSAHTAASQQFIAWHSGKCMDVKVSSQPVGAVQQYTCHGGLNQRFDVIHVTSTWHQIKFKHSGKCMDVKMTSQPIGAVQEYPCHGGDNQLFSIPSQGWWNIVKAKHSNKCLEIPNSSQSNQALVFEASCTYADNQKWFMGDHINDVFAKGRSPFTGWWDRFGLSHPSVHWRVECEPAQSGWYEYDPGCGTLNGDWSLDYYAAPGTRVDFKGDGIGGPFAAQVWAVMPTCGSTSSLGGYTVFVDVYVHGQKEGWISYGHLNDVQVTAGQWIFWGQPLGYLKDWGHSYGCYEVSSPSGVHSHIEMYNSSSFACYVNWGSGSYISSNSDLGHVGRSQYSGVQQAC